MRLNGGDQTSEWSYIEDRQHASRYLLTRPDGTSLPIRVIALKALPHVNWKRRVFLRMHNIFHKFSYRTLLAKGPLNHTLHAHDLTKYSLSQLTKIGLPTKNTQSFKNFIFSMTPEEIGYLLTDLNEVILPIELLRQSFINILQNQPVGQKANRIARYCRAAGISLYHLLLEAYRILSKDGKEALHLSPPIKYNLKKLVSEDTVNSLLCQHESYQPASVLSKTS